MKTKKHDTRWMVSVALMAAIVIVLANRSEEHTSELQSH